MTDLTWPQSLVPSGASFFLEPNTLRMESPLSRTSQVLVRTPPRWVARMEFASRDARKATLLDALIARMNGGEHTMRLWDFRRPIPRGAAGISTTTAFSDGTRFADGTGFEDYESNPTVSHPAARGAETVRSTGWDASQAPILAAGDYIGIGGYLYMLLDDAESDASGVAVLTIRPRLRAAIAAGDAIEFIRPTAAFLVVDGGQGDNRTAAPALSSYSIAFVEALA